MSGDLPGAGDFAACPCYTESDVKSVVEQTSREFRACQFNIAELALVEGTQDDKTVCTDCQYGTSGCYCKNPTSTTDELTQEEYTACAQILINVLKDVAHTCTPADPL